MADGRDEVKDLFNQRTKMLMLRFDQMEHSLDNLLCGAAPPLVITHRFAQTHTSVSETQVGSQSQTFEEEITPTVTTNVEAIGDSPTLSLQRVTAQTDPPQSQSPLEWARDMILRTDRLEQILDNLLGGDAPLSVSINQFKQTNTSDSEMQGDSPSLTSENVTAQVDTPDLESPLEWGRDMTLRFDQMEQHLDNLCRSGALQPEVTNPLEQASTSDSETKSDSLSLTLEDAITPTDTTDVEATGDCPTLSLQNVIAQTDPPQSQSPLEWAKDMMLRFDRLDQNLDNLLRGDDPLSVPINQFKQTNTSGSEMQGDSLSLTFDEAITPTVTINVEAIGDFQNVIAPTYTPDLSSPLEWGRQMMLRFDQMDQLLDILLSSDALQPEITNPFEQSNTSESETKSDSPSLSFEDAITPTDTSDFEAIGDSPELSLEDDKAQSDTPEFEAIGDSPELSLEDDKAESDTPDFKAIDYSPELSIKDDKAQIDAPEFEAIGDSPELSLLDDKAQINTPDFEAIDYSPELSLEDDKAQSDTPEFEAIDYSPELSLQDDQAQIDAPEFEVIDYSPELSLQDDQAQIDAPDLMSPLEWIQLITLRMSKLEWIQVITSRIDQMDQNLDNLVRDVALQPLFISPFDHTNTSDSETPGDYLSLTFEDANTQTVITAFEAIGDSPTLSLQDVSTHTEAPELEARDDSPPLEVRSVQTNTTDSETGYSPSLALQDLEIQEVQEVQEDPGLRGKESTAMELPVQQEVQELPEIREDLDLAMESKAVKLSALQGVPVLQEGQECLDVQMQEVNAVEIPEVLELMKLPKLLEPLEEWELQKALQILKTLELPIIPMEVPKATQELPEVQEVLVMQEDWKEQEVPKLPERPTVAVAPTVRPVDVNLQNRTNFDMTFVSRNGLRLFTYSFKSV